jgi:hypothetical protein
VSHPLNLSCSKMGNTSRNSDWASAWPLKKLTLTRVQNLYRACTIVKLRAALKGSCQSAIVAHQESRKLDDERIEKARKEEVKWLRNGNAPTESPMEPSRWVRTAPLRSATSTSSSSLMQEDRIGAMTQLPADRVDFGVAQPSTHESDTREHPAIRVEDRNITSVAHEKRIAEKLASVVKMTWANV